MKILSLKFSNINSLEGESRIDFDHPPFVDSGVFAITGPNGSGKTSILDAISLGLYGETFRFDRPSGQVMTKSAEECYAEVDFSLGEDVYRSSWYVNKDNGELQEPEMTLSRLNGSEQLLEEGTEKVLPKIRQITGMNFRRFAQSIVLAQGEFAAFLNAQDSDRLDVLEKLISEDVYADHKQKTLDKAQQADLQLKQLDQQIATLDLMSPEQVDAAAQDFDDFDDRLAELQKQKTLLQADQDQLSNWQSIENQITNLEQSKRQVQDVANQLQSNLSTITASTDVLNFESAIVSHDQTVLQLNQSRENQQNFQAELKNLQNQLAATGFENPETNLATDKSLSEQQQLIERLNRQKQQLQLDEQAEFNQVNNLDRQIAEKKALNSNIYDWLTAHAKEQFLLDDFPQMEKLKTLREDLATKKNQHKSFSKWEKNTLEAIKNKKSSIEKIKSQEKGLKNKLDIYQQELKSLSMGKTLEEIRLQNNEQSDRVKDYQELHSLASAHHKLTKEKFSWFGMPTEEEPGLDELNAQLKELSNQLEEEQQLQQELEKAIKFQNLLKQMEKYRPELSDGDPCPLCGADHHPYTARLPILDDPRPALSEKRIKIKEIKSKGHNLTKKIKEAEIKQQQEQEKQQGIKTTRSRWHVLCNRLNQATSDLNIDDIKQLADLVKQQQAEFDDISSLYKKYQAYENNIKETEQKLISQAGTAATLAAELEKLQADWDRRPQELIELADLVPKLSHEEKQLSDKILVQLDTLGEKMPASGKEEQITAKLNLKRQDFENYSKRRADLDQDLDKITQRITSSKEKISDLQQQQQAYAQRLQKEQVIGLFLAQKQQQQLVADTEQQIVQLQQEINDGQQQLNGQLQDSAYATIDKARERLKLVHSKAELEQQLSARENEINQFSASIEQMQVQLQNEQSQKSITSGEQEIINKITRLNEQIDIQNLEISTIQQKLQRQDQVKEQYEQLQQLRKQQLESKQQCDAEASLLDKENGHMFRRKVQKIMTEKFLQQANQVLEKINGRYYVHQCECEHGVALEIEDTQQQNIRRTPKSLSGGESFVVSLALALGLSELANNGKAVDSLFIDEGFGTLDPNTLSAVVNTLEELQIHGKTVGVISHVDAVRKRFKTRIEAIKKPNGLSELKVPKRSGVSLKLRPFRKSKLGQAAS